MTMMMPAVREWDIGVGAGSERDYAQVVPPL
jgi:hypothetical protein